MEPFIEFHFFSLFFFPAKSCFFFPGKVYPSLTHSISEGGKKKASEKKNTIFTHSLEKPPKGANFNLFRVKKKYDTFGTSIRSKGKSGKRGQIFDARFSGLAARDH